MTAPLMGAPAAQDIPASPIPAAAKPQSRLFARLHLLGRNRPRSSLKCSGSRGSKALRGFLAGRLIDAFGEEFTGLNLTSESGL
jgi:hypothetical protein